MNVIQVQEARRNSIMTFLTGLGLIFAGCAIRTILKNRRSESHEAKQLKPVPNPTPKPAGFCEGPQQT